MISILLGVVLRSGKALGIDTLDLFDPTEGYVELREITRGVALALPHLGLFIDWDTSVSQTPSIGDFVAVTNLQPRHGIDELLLYSYDTAELLSKRLITLHSNFLDAWSACISLLEAVVRFR